MHWYQQVYERTLKSEYNVGIVGGGLVTKSCPTLAISCTVACKAPLSIGFSRQKYWGGLPFPSPCNGNNISKKKKNTKLNFNSLYLQSYKLLEECILKSERKNRKF